jgi:starch synthase (maltosyl-transferring)
VLNPHTKPVPFWEWLIRTVQFEHPDVIFLSESFTRPPMLRMMAKVGFTQSYTYFTWRTFKGELVEYFTELTQGDATEYLRPNLFPNTPDILPKFLQTGGRPAFQIRFVLAATLSSVYGIYNGFELCEAAALPNSEEYLDSEKYQYKVWDWNRPGNIKDYITAINRIRAENPALQYLRNLRFYDASDGNVLFYGKMTAARDNAVFIAVNLDPFEAHESDLRFPLDDLRIPEQENFLVEDLLSGDKHLWCGATHRVRLDPHHNPAVFFRVSPWERVDFRQPGP